MNNKLKFLLVGLSLIAATVWLAVFTFPDKKLHLITCDVGQGDATIAVYGKTQILIDGGPNSKILDCLSKNTAFWDREMELVILTHPQTDHFTGLIEVFKRYRVKYFIANSLDSSSQEYGVLKKLVGGSGTSIINPVEGMVIRVGMIYLDILNPTQQFLQENGGGQASQNTNGILGAYTSDKDPNEFSVVAILSYKNFDALFTGDIDTDISDEISQKLKVKSQKSIEYIKVPHHGSKNGLSENLLKTVSPEFAVISVGKNNSYGHPHKETLDLLKKYGIKIFRTDETGDIELLTNGEKYWLDK